MSQPPLARGDRAPNFLLPDAEGKLQMFYDLTQGGPALLGFAPMVPEDGARDMVEALVQAKARLAPLRAEAYAVLSGASASLAKLGAAGIPMLADADGKAGALYPVAGSLAAPRAFALDANQRVLHAANAGPPAAQVESCAQWLEANFRRGAAGEVSAIAPVLFVTEALDAEFRAELIAAWHKDHAETGVSGGTDAILYDKKKSLDHVVRNPQRSKRLSDMLNRRLMPEVHKAFAFRGPYVFDGHIVLGYAAGRGDFFGLHRDNLAARTRHRRFAVSLNLNDDFEGGELRFPEYGDTLYKMPAGTACVFSCSLLHEALPIRKGTRLVLTTFMCDPPAQGPAAKR